MTQQAQFFRALGKVVIQGAKQVGTRAAAHGMKSVFRDGERLANGVRKKLASAIDKLEEMTAIEDEDDDRTF
jgi:hypothetical protein